ncbi:AAA family ATPase [Ramlibacter albus]|uniref:AAA family ATPase n=1 Tax=Ramlibacter albus TaxID=2079448 RepID=A0A923S471_9BURK|nr:AAA family ATPase [Ramlibacter albus]
MKHGLVIGKFYPPHAGHHLLVQTAAACCERVTVVVMAATCESIPLQQRVGWMRDAHARSANVAVTGITDDVPMDLHSDTVWSQHVALMRAALAWIGAPPVTAVFTSEPYGQELARRFNATAVTLDTARTLVPVSATRIRADLPGHWGFLAAPVRRSLAVRVVVVGAESTGTTTLSRALQSSLRSRGGAFTETGWVGEYGREYSVHKFARATAQAQLAGEVPPRFEQLAWRSEEFVDIAREQLRRQREAAAQGGPVLVCDTDAFATAIWHERYMGSRDPHVERIAAEEPGDLYLVTHDRGVPFEQDGLRDGESIRGWMTACFLERLAEKGLPHAVLEGSPQQRLETALGHVDALMERSWRFAPPLA